MKKKLVGLLAVLLSFAMIAAACGDDDSDSSSDASSSEASSSEASSSEASSSEQMTMTIQMRMDTITMTKKHLNQLLIQ